MPGGKGGSHLLVAMMMMPSCRSTSVSSRFTWWDPRFSLRRENGGRRGVVNKYRGLSLVCSSGTGKGLR